MQPLASFRSLQQHLDKLPAGFPPARSGADIHVLRQLFTPLEAQIATLLRIIPTPLGLINFRARRFGLTRPVLQAQLDGMVAKGLILRRKLGAILFYQNAKFVIGIYEFQGSRLTKDFMTNLDLYCEEALARDLMVNGGVKQIRTIPVEQSVSTTQSIFSYDDVRTILQKNKGPIGIAKCVCRAGQGLLGHPCQQTRLEESCFTFGAVAKYWINNGLARAISPAVASEILRKAQEDGLILQPGNEVSPGFICTCCRCCCLALKILNKFPRPVDHYHVNYQAVVDRNVCEECGTCVPRCAMGALELRDTGLWINPHRCLGCGQCVISCPQKALFLQRKSKTFKPPQSGFLLNFRLLLQKHGPWKAIKTLL